MTIAFVTVLRVGETNIAIPTWMAWAVVVFVVLVIIGVVVGE